ncbi:MAG: 7-cyano-7-deazaguanine synthase QueC [Candidatus Omnitrophica bacterium]|jgi:7-cyano-7-deazaguanine synthase|nr:7-cyano-7-deazaguanine synthase QueC [Candidatus Omnitrophota bacterium]
MKNKAVVLLSGGLDSAVTLYWAKKQGYKCHCLIFDYGQRHKKEILAAKRIARKAHCPLEVVKISLPWQGSSLIDKRSDIPMARKPGEIPSTYVPARNIIFLSFALSFAEAIKSGTVFIGAHIQDYSGYPDCRPEFLSAFDHAAKCGTKTGTTGKGVVIKTPLIDMHKSQIIQLGIDLGVDFKDTWSCYKGLRLPCGKCDSCHYRNHGFSQLGMVDPLTKKR